ncbi:MAG: hypothetical protein GC160_02660 [Acidobacteria bacterium]|nr:hypothetical protein [Acidobacteriota bacterium]
MRKILPIALLAAVLAGPFAPLVSAGDQGSSFSLFDHKTKKRAAKSWKKTQKDLRKNAKSYNKTGRKALKRADKNLRKKMKSWSR